MGKTNTPEMGLGITTEPSLFGPTSNPWDLQRTPGGSSGGSAAAVASGIVAIAHGNDAGGSIRIPASCCGVFGLKPSRARNPLGPAFGDMMGGLVAEHVLTRSVRDSAAMLDATAGPGIGDPYAVPHPEISFLEAVTRDTNSLRIAFSSQPPLDSPVHPDCVAALEEAALLCQQLGHQVAEDRPALDGELLFQSFTQVLSAGFAWCLDDLSRSLNRELREDLFEPFVWSIAQRGRQISGPEYLSAWQNLQRTCPTGGSFPDPLRSLADADFGETSSAPRHFPLRRERPLRVETPHVGIFPLHLLGQRNRAAGHVSPALLECGGAAHRNPFPGPLRPRNNVVRTGGTTGADPTLVATTTDLSWICTFPPAAARQRCGSLGHAALASWTLGRKTPARPGNVQDCKLEVKCVPRWWDLTCRRPLQVRDMLLENRRIQESLQCDPINRLSSRC